MRFLSLFSGIEAASVAWKPLGWECVGVAEVDKFAKALLEHHYPGVPNLGDITKITKAKIKKLGHIDAVVFGWPCQDLSVAGKRAGLKGERSGLFFDAMRIVRWSGARWAVAENVPGLFSSDSGRDFAAVVGAMVGVQVGVPHGGWRNSGVLAGPDGLVEWAVLDAQWFGVPQRRRRVFFVRDTGDWASRPPVLLERESLQGNPPPRRQTGQGATAGTLRSTDGGVDADHAAANHVVATLDASFGRLQGTSGQDARHGHSHLVAFGGNNTSGEIEVATALQAHGGPHGRQDFASETFVAHTLRGEGFDAMEDGTGRGTPLVPVFGIDEEQNATEDVFGCLKSRREGGGFEGTIAFQANLGSHGGGIEDDCGTTLKSTQGPPAVVVPILEAGARTGPSSNDDPKAGMGIGKAGDPMFTLQTRRQHAVAIRTANTGANGHGVAEDVAHTLDQAQGQAVVFESRFVRNGRGAPSDVVPPLKAQSGETGKGDAAPLAVTFAPQAAGAQTTLGYDPSKETCQTLGVNQKPAMAQGMAVRRLTPRECERLQGFPDDYTIISAKTADGSRYKSLGNSFAVPVVRWIGKRIQEVLA